LADAFPISGTIDPKAFPYLLMDLHRHGATGSLKVEGPSYQKALYFRSGRVLFGSSNDPRDQLGAILIETGKITPEQLEDVTAKVGPGNPLAKALADTGYVSQRELSDAARAKVETILSDVLGYTAGNFEFEDGVLPKGAIDLKLSTEKLVLASVRRLTDRNFVLRHLDGLEVVLTPTTELMSRLLELEPEAGGLPEKLDGKQTLKEAAAQTRLEEFEAAKVACALLFLGLVQRAPVPIAMAEDARLAEDPLFNITGKGDTGGGAEELDLLGTARASVETTPAPLSVPIPEPEPEPEPEIAAQPDPSAPALPIAMAAAAAPDPRDAAPETPFFIPEEDEAPARAPEPEPFQMESEPLPTAVPEAQPFRIDPEPFSEAMPEPEAAPEEQAEAEIMPATIMMAPPTVMMPAPNPVKARPSKDDQAALDALLNAPAVPPSPASSGRRASKADNWAPSASRPPVRRSVGGPSPMVLGGAVLVLVAAAAGAAWYLWGRTPAAPGGKVATGPATPTSTVAPAPVTPSPQPTPVAGTTPPGAARTAPASLAEARGLLRSGDLDQAAQGFAATVKAAPRGSASVQILVACSPETVQKALQNAGSPELFIVPVNYQGRDCYRLCWGLFENAGVAASEMGKLPEYFRKGARPRVIAASEIVR
jgi:hypothetical protein